MGRKVVYFRKRGVTGVLDPEILDENKTRIFIKKSFYEIFINSSSYSLNTSKEPLQYSIQDRWIEIPILRDYQTVDKIDLVEGRSL